MVKQTYLDKIRTRVGRELPSNDYTEEELQILVDLLPASLPISEYPVQIPLAVNRALDPRLKNPIYLSRITEQKCWPARAQDLHLPFLKLPLIIALENVLVSVTHLSLYEEVGRQIEAVQRRLGDGYVIKDLLCEGKRYLLIERPHATAFLESLLETHSFHLISSLPPCLIASILTAFMWTPYFISTISKSGTAIIAEDFPMVTDPERLVVIVDDKEERWRKDRKRVFPSLRFSVKTGEAQSRNREERPDLCYLFGPKMIFFEENRANNTIFETKTRQQLTALCELLQKTAKHVWMEKYATVVVARLKKYAYKRAFEKYRGRKVKVLWWTEEEYRALEYIVRVMGGRPEEKVSQADIVITSDSTTEVFGNKTTVPASQLYSSYFLV